MPYIVTIFLSCISIYVFTRLVDWLGLMDYPCERKQHEGAIPVIGGLSVFTSFLVSILLFTELSKPICLFIIASSLMVYIGVLDDKYDLSVRSRLIGQFIVSSILVFGIGVYLVSLGNIFALGEISLGYAGIVVTYILIIGVINAFNMIDGIDGLLATVSLVALSGLAVLAFYLGNEELLKYCLLFICCLIPFLLANLNLLPFNKVKIFMGDAGSMFIGFAIVWMFINNLSLNREFQSFRPVVGLFLLGLPLIDMVAIMYRRIKKRSSPFKADREHIHHIFMKAGFNARETLLIISLFAFMVTALGVVMELNKLSEWVMLLVFLLIFAAYNLAISHAWKFSRFIHKFKKRAND